MNFKDFLQTNIVILDGGMGTMLEKEGLAPPERPEAWNILHPDIIEKIQLAYFDAGANVVNTNTFGANGLKYGTEELTRIITSAVDIARRAKGRSTADTEKFIALDIGPLGRLLSPIGDLAFEDAVAIFSEVVRIGAEAGADLITIETMNDAYETKAALLAAKEASTLPVIVTNSYGTDGKLMTGASPAAMAALIEGLSADAMGVNCTDPETLKRVIPELLSCASIPVIAKPNAGIPRLVGNKTVFDVDPLAFASLLASLIPLGVRAVGGCCGTTPEHIRELSQAAKAYTPTPISDKGLTVVSSYTHAVAFGKSPLIIGERINPTGKPRFKDALKSRDISYILTEGIKEADEGAHILDVNVGLPEINEGELLPAVIKELQAVTDVPLCIDTSDEYAMEAALRIYNGKPLINSVSGTKESMEKIFPLAKKYGGVIIALTLDEGGIPDTAEERISIAKKILAEAALYGIDKNNIIFDPLTLTVSTDGNAAATTLETLGLIKRELGCYTSLGVSNVSFGLPERDVLNSTFFTLALGAGLSAAIMNPHAERMMSAYRAYRALTGLDTGCAEYISAAKSKDAAGQEKSVSTMTLGEAVERGLSDMARRLTEELISTSLPLDIINRELIPALDRVGVGFEKKTVYLPELLMSAEAASASFGVIKAARTERAEAKSARILIATVKGDIHDIGKNIVKLLLENYGFPVYDLGRDVPPELILERARELSVDIVGLSALMTTTAPEMEKTVKLLTSQLPSVKIMVGGAVITDEYARSIGADYVADAMASVRYAEAVEKELASKSN